jgi:hypothetical protein
MFFVVYIQTATNVLVTPMYPDKVVRNYMLWRSRRPRALRDEQKRHFTQSVHDRRISNVSAREAVRPML